MCFDTSCSGDDWNRKSHGFQLRRVSIKGYLSWSCAVSTGGCHGQCPSTQKQIVVANSTRNSNENRSCKGGNSVVVIRVVVSVIKALPGRPSSLPRCSSCWISMAGWLALTSPLPASAKATTRVVVGLEKVEAVNLFTYNSGHCSHSNELHEKLV